MSEIDKKTVEHIAKLAQLKITETEAQEFSLQLSKVMSYFEQISKVDTTGVEPLVTPTEIESVWRLDTEQANYTTEEIMQNSPHRTGNLFTVPPVV